VARQNVPSPAERCLRVFAIDPAAASLGVPNEVTLRIAWEDGLEAGPRGEYVEVVDTDAAGEQVHPPLDLDRADVLAAGGLAPSDGDPAFRQQMTFAVAMRTIESFERALGRPAQWAPRARGGFRRRLAIHPHYDETLDASYDREAGVCLGYGRAGDALVLTCLSQDAIARAVTEALLDGLNLELGAELSRAFADLVALLQHFGEGDVLEREIARVRGDLRERSLLGAVAPQLAAALGRPDGVWRPRPPDAQAAERGDIAVAAVFLAFTHIYDARVADLRRIASRGTGVLAAGALHPDLVRRLAREASLVAQHVLNMCIRALDYLPPVDVTFFEYLRALITADFDLVSDDRHNYRVAFVEAFRRRGIYPLDMDARSPDALRTLSVDTLRWEGLDLDGFSRKAQAKIWEQYRGILDGLKRYADACIYLKDRETLFHVTREQRRVMHGQLAAAYKAVPAFAHLLRIDPAQKFEVHELRRALRIGADGRDYPQIIVALTQAKRFKNDKASGTPSHVFRGGSTLIVDLSGPDIKYKIHKNINSPERQERTASFIREAATDPLRALFFAPDRREPFAALHALADEGL